MLGITADVQWHDDVLTFVPVLNAGVQSSVQEQPVSQAVTGKLKPAHEVYHQILHDQDLQDAVGGIDAVVVGYHDRFVGTLECTMQEYAALEIPFHRVRHYRSSAVAKYGGMMWDRSSRINNMRIFKYDRLEEN